MTVEDTRYFLKNRNDVNQYAKEFEYKHEAELKKLDHKNRGKVHRKDKCLNLNLKTNLSTMLTPNNRFKIMIRAIGLPFVVAEYLDKQVDKMVKLFTYREEELEDVNGDQKRRELVVGLRNEFVKEMVRVMEEEGI